MALKRWIDSWKNRVTEEITKSLDDLKESVKLKAREKEKKMIQRQLEERIDLYGIIIETDISEAKNEWLNSKEEKTIREVFKRYEEDMRKHPEAYILSEEDAKKYNYKITQWSAIWFWVLEDFEANKSLWAEFELTPEEEKLINKYKIWVFMELE